MQTSELYAAAAGRNVAARVSEKAIERDLFNKLVFFIDHSSLKAAKVIHLAI